MRIRETPKGVFLGANDAASGVAAMLMEMARHMPNLKRKYGGRFRAVRWRGTSLSNSRSGAAELPGSGAVLLGIGTFCQGLLGQPTEAYLQVGGGAGHGWGTQFAIAGRAN